MPQWLFDDCNPEFIGGQISELWMGARGQAFTDVYNITTGATEVTTRLASATETRLEILTVLGDKAAPEETVQDFSGGRQQVMSRKHTINFEIDEINDTNYAAMRQIQAGGGQFQIWYTVADGKYLYGGNKGIPVSVRMSELIPREKNGKMVLSGTLTWDARQSPIRGLNPIYSAAA